VTDLGPSLAALEALDLAYARFNAQRSLRPRDPELTVTEVGELRVLHDPSRPDDETYNRVLGLDAARLDRLDQALEVFADTPPQVDVAVDRMDPALCAALVERGLSPARTLVWMWARPEAMQQEASAAIEVERIDGQADLLLDLIGRLGKPVEPVVRERRRRYFCTDTFRAFVARIDGEPAGWATLWVDGDRAILGNADTFEAYRRRGVQSALIRARARDAAAQGLSWVVADTLPETSSHRNALRAGMRRRTSYVWWR